MEERARVSEKLRNRLLLGALVLAAIGGTAALAAPVVNDHPASRASAPAATAPVPAPAVEKLVWEGADVDGDGQPDFANPTGHAERTTDAYGCGEFGASRDGGERKHEGVDFKADAGQTVVAPLSGYVTKIGYAYPGDETLKFVEITNPALHYQARAFYVDPGVKVGEAVHVGQPIGTHHTLERKYPDGMTDHVHLEIIDRRGDRIDANQVLTARLETVPATARG